MDSSTDDDNAFEQDGVTLFFGPFAAPSLQERRARQPREEAAPRWVNGRICKPRKKRKVETKPRALRNDHEYGEGDIRRLRLDPELSPWWRLIRHPDVYDERSAACRRGQEGRGGCRQAGSGHHREEKAEAAEGTENRYQQGLCTVDAD